MQLNNLKPAAGATHATKRIGRGEGSGHGGTATKGNKGQQARTGSKRKNGHEGGQMPIQRRMPKRGFNNPFRVEYTVFNIGDLDFLVEKYGLTEFSMDTLYLNGLIGRSDIHVKILGNGAIQSKLNFKVSAVSKKAKEAIEAAGGTIELI
jgi:large subunit ribosomal protein L15